MPLCTAEAVLKRVANALTTPVEHVDPRWAELAAAGRKSAVAYLTSAIGLKAYSADQITASDQFATWHEDLAFVFAMLNGASLANYPLDALKAFDPRDMLAKPVVLLFGGKVLPPDGTSPVGGVSSGTLDAVAEVTCATAKYFR